jgi:hypothetical protein
MKNHNLTKTQFISKFHPKKWRTKNYSLSNSNSLKVLKLNESLFALRVSSYQSLIIPSVLYWFKNENELKRIPIPTIRGLFLWSVITIPAWSIKDHNQWKSFVFAYAGILGIQLLFMPLALHVIKRDVKSLM